ncbi:MAG: PEP-CTERM sorting domain-containing protein [Microcystis aeruginosa]
MGSEQAFNQPGWSPVEVYIPEPSAVVGLLGLGLGALASRVRKKG